MRLCVPGVQQRGVLTISPPWVTGETQGDLRQRKRAAGFPGGHRVTRILWQTPPVTQK